MSCSLASAGNLSNNLGSPDVLSARKALAQPSLWLLATNQTSFPDGAQASPSRLPQGPDKRFRCPWVSTITTLPPSSPKAGWSAKATISALGDNRTEEIQPELCARTLPAGN